MHYVYIMSTSCEMPGWMKHKLESRMLGEISITSDTQMTESEKELKSLLMKVKEVVMYEFESWTIKKAEC